MMHIAAVHPASTRLALGLLGLAVFGGLATTNWRRPTPAIAITALCLIAAGWLFGATLVWGTGYTTKVRWSAAWTYDGNAWQWTGLLALAMGGVLSMGAALREFAQEKRREGWTFAAIAAGAFVAWSAVVRYSVAAAAFVLLAGGSALFLAAKPASPSAMAASAPNGRKRATVPLLLTTIVIGFAWSFIALAWLVIGPEGRPTCHCWADNYNDWRYQTQFIVAVAGALSLLAAALAYNLKRHRLLLFTGSLAATSIAAWIAFAVTGSA